MIIKKTYSTDSAVTISYNEAAQTVKPVYTTISTVLTKNGTVIGTNPSTLTVQNGDTISTTGGIAIFQTVANWGFPEEAPLSPFRWADLSDSLGDTSLHGTSLGIKGNYKYSRIIADKTGLNVSYLSKGGCGFYKGGGTDYGTGNIASVRAQQIPHDTDLVTLWGSYNDQIIYSYVATNIECNESDPWYNKPTFGRIPICLDTNGNPVWKKGVSADYLYGGQALTYDVIKQCPLNETLSGIDGTPIARTFVAYVNEAIHVAKQRAPFAKIRMVSGGWCNNNGENNQMWRNIQFLLWEIACRNNYVWLNLLWNSYPGKGYPAGYTDKIPQYRVGKDFYGNDVDFRNAVLNQGNPYLNFRDGWGLSYGQANSDHEIASDPAASDLFTISYGWWESPGHMNDDYHEQFMAPVVLGYICRWMGYPIEKMPERCRAKIEDITFRSDFTEYVNLGAKVSEVSRINSKKDIKIKIGGVENINASVIPSTATEKGLIYESQYPLIASISDGGEISGISAGYSKIYITSIDGSIRAEANVSVNGYAESVYNYQRQPINNWYDYFGYENVKIYPKG